MSDKELVIDRIQHLPESASVFQIVEELQILAAIHEGQQAAVEGRVKPHEQVKELLAAWTAK